MSLGLTDTAASFVLTLGISAQLEIGTTLPIVVTAWSDPGVHVEATGTITITIAAAAAAATPVIPAFTG